jgi:hypothetical protein
MLPPSVGCALYQSGTFKAMVCENDQTQFMETSLPVIDHGDGYLEIQTNHLSGFGVEVVPESVTSCDDDRNCFVGGCWGCDTYVSGHKFSG